MTGPRYTPVVARLPSTVPFVGPEAQERARGAPFAARLGANENAFGASPRAVGAIRRAAADIWMYGDPENHELRQALAEHHGVAPENVMVGEGIDGLLGILVRLVVDAGDKVVTSDGAYPTFNYHVAAQGGVLVKVPYKGDFEDPVALIETAIEVAPKLIYMSNPDNPMGTVHPAPVIEATIAAVPEGSLLVLDEAYVEFAPEGTAAPFRPDDPRVIRLRTFSKAYGMAGARIGYAIGHAGLIAAFDRIRNHFGVARLSQVGALEALRDQRHLARVVDQVAAARRRLARIAQDNGLQVVPSAANFVCIDCGQDGAFARKVLDALARRGVFVRMPFVAPQDRCIRVTCAPDEMLDVFAAALPEALAEARG